MDLACGQLMECDKSYQHGWLVYLANCLSFSCDRKVGALSSPCLMPPPWAARPFLSSQAVLMAGCSEEQKGFLCCRDHSTLRAGKCIYKTWKFQGGQGLGGWVCIILKARAIATLHFLPPLEPARALWGMGSWVLKIQVWQGRSVPAPLLTLSPSPVWPNSFSLSSCLCCSLIPTSLFWFPLCGPGQMSPTPACRDTVHILLSGSW